MAVSTKTPAHSNSPKTPANSNVRRRRPASKPAKAPAPIVYLDPVVPNGAVELLKKGTKANIFHDGKLHHAIFDPETETYRSNTVPGVVFEFTPVAVSSHAASLVDVTLYG